MAFTLNQPIGTNYRADPDDIMNTKRALNQLGYYKVPAHRGIDDWTDDAMFDGIRSFQKANGLKVDAFMRPDGPTAKAINNHVQLAVNESADQQQRPGVIDTIKPRCRRGRRHVGQLPGHARREREEFGQVLSLQRELRGHSARLRW